MEVYEALLARHYLPLTGKLPPAIDTLPMAVKSNSLINGQSGEPSDRYSSFITTHHSPNHAT
jgi:hypothetical protein